MEECYCLNEDCLFNRGKDWDDCMFVIVDDHPNWDKKICPFYRNKFIITLNGLSGDMEDFILEQADYYDHHKEKFWTSFYRTCSDMWVNGIDLSDKQLAIIYREYNKVKKDRETLISR